MNRKQRIATIRAARAFSARGQDALARQWFALVGISYVPTIELASVMIPSKEPAQ